LRLGELHVDQLAGALQAVERIGRMARRLNADAAAR
jgi:hypothetical protein